MNDQVARISDTVRVISNDGGELQGVVPTSDAIANARSQGLDLIVVNPNTNPPVCRIVEYGKFRFEKKKKEKEAKKNQKTTELKKIRLSVKIDSGDFNTKLKQAKDFIFEGDKVEISIRFRGREMQHADLGLSVIGDFCKECYLFAETLKSPRVDGKHAFALLGPLSAKAREARKKEMELKESLQNSEIEQNNNVEPIQSPN